MRLEVPASPEFLRLARITAAGVASRLGFTYDEVEDLRIAIDELCYSLVGNRGRPGTITLSYHMLPEGLEVQGSGRFGDGHSGEPTLSPFSLQILHSVTDECEVEDAPQGPVFRMLKRRG